MANCILAASPSISRSRTNMFSGLISLWTRPSSIKKIKFLKKKIKREKRKSWEIKRVRGERVGQECKSESREGYRGVQERVEIVRE